MCRLHVVWCFFSLLNENELMVPERDVPVARRFSIKSNKYHKRTTNNTKKKLEEKEIERGIENGENAESSFISLELPNWRTIIFSSAQTMIERTNRTSDIPIQSWILILSRRKHNKYVTGGLDRNGLHVIASSYTWNKIVYDHILVTKS